ncbi:MAG: GNAT family N-acetyltransferase [Verrucomicrobia bacterium]|nr:GNAT family N-acetyltransferase [Verrucomicrobiota bacterium]
MIQNAASGFALGKDEAIKPETPEVNSRWTFQCVRGKEGLKSLEESWQSLADSDPQLAFYQCPAWAHAYLEHLAPQSEEIIFITGWRNQNLRLVLPLECVGSELLDRFPEPLALQRNLEGSAWLPCDRSYADLLKGASANHRSNLVRGQKRAAKLGSMRYDSFSQPDQLKTAMLHFLSIEASGWKGAQGGAVACKPELVAFYSTLCASLGSQGRCEIDLLWLESDPIASIFWFRTGGVLHLQKIAYLEKLSELGPGRLIMAEALQRACADSALRRINFITRCPWADGWRTEIAPVRDWTIYPNTWIGRVVFTLERVKISFKQRLRSLLKKRLADYLCYEALWELPADLFQAGSML